MKIKQYTDEDIFNAILSNDKDVLFFLYKHNFEKLLQLVKLGGGNEKDAEDAFHDALLIVFLKIRAKSLVLTCSIHTYLLAVAKLCWKKQINRNSINFSNLGENVDFMSEELKYDEDHFKIERRNLYLKHLEELPTDCKRLIKFIIEGFSLEEITKLMPFNSIEFTKTKRFRCKVMLIKKIQNDPQYNELKNERSGTTDSLPRW